MESCVRARPRSPNPYNCMKEVEKRKRLEAESLKRFAPDSVWEKALELMRKRPEGALRRFNRERRAWEAKEALYNHGEPCLIEGFEPEAKKDGSLWGTVSFWSPKAKRMTKFEPADKSRGSQGAGHVEPKTGLPSGSCNISPETVAEMLRTSNQLLQAVLQLLQRGPESQEVRGEEKQGEKIECVKD